MNVDSSSLENFFQKKKSKKPRRCFALAEFVVIKKKCKKTNKLTFKKLHVKDRKIRRRVRKTTLKKKILIARTEKRDQQQVIVELTADLNKLDLEIKENERDIKHSSEVKQLSITIIKMIFQFQEKKFQQNPIKAKAHKRYVVGFKEVRKFLIVEKLKLIFIAQDLEKNVEVDKLVEEIIALAVQHKCFYVFSIPRRKLGYLLLKKVPVSIIGIFDYQGITESVNSLMTLVEQEKLNYNKSINS